MQGSLKWQALKWLGAVGLLAGIPMQVHAAEPVCTLENQFVQYVIGGNGQNLHFYDRQKQKDYLLGKSSGAFARIKRDGKYIDASGVTFADGRLTVRFADSGVQALIKATLKPRYLVFEVLACTGAPVDELVLVDIPLSLQGTPGEAFAACALALNLQTRVDELPRPSSRLHAMCYPRFGLAGSKVALIGCPPDQLRDVMQEVVSAADELPHSPIGGPWALGPSINQGSYLFNFGDLSEKTVDDWIKLIRTLGMTQIDFHGGGSFRFGDCFPNPVTYPKGLPSLKAVVDRLHAAGISAGLHTYSFFIDKRCPWVTPVPDPRLAKDAAFTLADSLAADAKVVPVVESTENMSAVTGFFVRNSVTLQVDDELITYTGISKTPPYAFTGCQRGACGTREAAHARGATVHHLKECFGLFVPDGDSTLLAEVAAKTAETFNACGFDMMYFDALDGEDILGGAENGWYYGSKFVFEVWKRLRKPALMEMSTFHHHLWFVRSRLGAWDHPNRSHKAFIDLHCRANEDCRRMFLPGQLGWWAIKTWSGSQEEPTYADDIEYLMCKCLGTDTGFALMGIDPGNFNKVPALPRLAKIIQQYDAPARPHTVPQAIRDALAMYGHDYTLTNDQSGKPIFRPVEYLKHKVESGEDWSCVWHITNRFDQQPVRLRIEVLMSAEPFDSTNSITLADTAAAAEFASHASAPGVTADFSPSSDQIKAGQSSALYKAANSLDTRAGTWTKVEKTFSPPLNLSGHEALGLWVYGDGQGQVLNLQLRCPEHLVAGIGEHYILVDFTGWRYFELIEPEGSRYADYRWPYGGAYSIYRESVNFSQIASLGLWYNHLPPKGQVACYLSPIRALPLVKAKLDHPAITIAGKTVVFPVEMESGSYLEFNGKSDCKCYGPQGELIDDVHIEGDTPVLATGLNEVRFHCEKPSPITPRANVVVISQGQSFSADGK
ncbi:MAG: hypothetical protein M1608_15420 [Candidatus Omnitrophica bacterium]|nr:hypothetical protein [Candidatus Omnitrophota bacterium]